MRRYIYIGSCIILFHIYVIKIKSYYQYETYIYLYYIYMSCMYVRAGTVTLRFFKHQTFCQLQPRRGACAVITGSTVPGRRARGTKRATCTRKLLRRHKTGHGASMGTRPGETRT
jgi:hypothetical protein